MASRGIKTIEELRDIVVSEMEAGHSDVLDVKATDMVGSTGMELHGIMVFRKKSETAVTIYLNSYWESYVSKEKSLLEIYNCIVNSALAEQSEKDTIKEIVSNYPAIKGLLKPMLINNEANKIELEHRSHRQFVSRRLRITEEGGAYTIYDAKYGRIKNANATKEEADACIRDVQERRSKYRKQRKNYR